MLEVAGGILLALIIVTFLDWVLAGLGILAILGVMSLCVYYWDDYQTSKEVEAQYKLCATLSWQQMQDYRQGRSTEDPCPKTR